ncbi:hypothetical protein [Flavobacterium sp.]|uniref:hypothetical protein n=1 Tax=Flavobacterium sp. TaxID=239 RepID=UPI003D6BB23F
MWKSILTTTVFAGTLDILAACLNAYLSNHIMPDIVLKYIASGVFGSSAFTGGTSMVLFGLLFHFVIAFACTAVFYWLYPKVPFFKFSLTVNAVLIALAAWFITTRIVIPMSHITPTPFSFSKALAAVSILIVCIGIPIAYQSKRFYQQ